MTARKIAGFSLMLLLTLAGIALLTWLTLTLQREYGWSERKAFAALSPLGLLICGGVLWIGLRAYGEQTHFSARELFEMMQSQAAAEARSRALIEQRKQARIAELARDPVKSRYIPYIERGDFITDEQIAYWENPAARATCSHLAGLEGQMRAAGYDVRPMFRPGFASARCLVVPGYQPPEGIEYHEDGNPRDAWYAYFFCRECQATLETVHPNDAGSRTPQFPPGS